MSYDVDIDVTFEGEVIDGSWRNHTSNTAVMWREAGCDIAEFDGKSAGEFAVALFAAVVDMDLRPEHYAQWNPENGWGSVETTRAFLADLLRDCRLYPTGTVRVSR